MDTTRYIEIPKDSVRKAIALAYDMSSPRGLGFLHFKGGGLSEAEIDEIVSRSSGHSISMDYVNGRCCKFHIYLGGFAAGADDGRRFISPSWYDHSRADLIELLEGIGIDDPAGKIDAAIAGREAA